MKGKTAKKQTTTKTKKAKKRCIEICNVGYTNNAGRVGYMNNAGKIGKIKRKKKKRVGALKNLSAESMNTIKNIAIASGGAIGLRFILNKVYEFIPVSFIKENKNIVNTAIGIIGSVLIKNNYAKKALEGHTVASVISLLIEKYPTTIGRINGMRVINGIGGDVFFDGSGQRIGALATNIKTLIDRMYSNYASISKDDGIAIRDAIGTSGTGISCPAGFVNLQDVKKLAVQRIAEWDAYYKQQEENNCYKPVVPSVKPQVQPPAAGGAAGGAVRGTACRA